MFFRLKPTWEKLLFAFTKRIIGKIFMAVFVFFIDVGIELLSLRNRLPVKYYIQINIATSDLAKTTSAIIGSTK